MTTAAGALQEIPLEDLHESPHNLRHIFAAEPLKELAASILQVGVLTPLTVRPRQAGGYEIGAGHRRARAAKLAGLTAVPAFIRNLDDRAFLELLTIENLQRDDLHPLEEAQGYVALMQGAGYDVARIADRIGKSPRHVYDSLTLLKLIPQAKKLFLAGKFERGHAVELARLSKDWQETALAAEDQRWARVGGLFQDEHVEPDPQASAQEKLALEDARKPVSVREFKTWINDNVRATPDAIDPFLFPQTAQQLAAVAAQKRGKLVHITYDYRVPDAARDPKIRTFGEAGWKRADGQFQSKACEHAVLGLVVAGPGRGEAFPVCVAKEKCAVHWADWQRERTRRQKEMARHPQRREREGAKKPRTVPFEETDAGSKAIAATLQELAPKIAGDVDALATRELEGVSDVLAWNLNHWIAENGGPLAWAKPGQLPNGLDSYETEDLTDVVLLLLPGKWKKSHGGSPAPTDVRAARSGLAWYIYLARELDQKAFRAEVEKIAKAKVAAAAPAKLHTCERCGCDEAHACTGGCSSDAVFLKKKHYVCSACVKLKQPAAKKGKRG